MLELSRLKLNRRRFSAKSARTKGRSKLKCWLLSFGISTFVATSPLGCTRSHYRNTADAETNCLIEQKISAASVPQIRPVQVDRASRMFDPFNPDRPPMPEDDPVAHRYMQRIDGKKHYPLWDVNGRTNTTESPDWWQMLPLDERGVLVLDSNTAMRLASLHSSLYQTEVETLYLSALDVSSERFLLDNQFYAGWQADYVADGPSRRNAGGQSRSNLSTGPFSRARRPFSWQRRFASGTDLVVGFANSMTWQLSGPDTQSATTLLDFSLIQPLLRGGGRDVILERLTLAERILLQNVRAFERYKTGFYVTVTAGRQAETGPSRRGGLFGGAGLEGFSGLGGGFGTVGNVQQRNATTGFGGGGAVPNVGGILGLIQNQLQIKNSQENISRLQDNLLRFEDALREQLMKIAPTQDTIPSQQLQVAQARQALVSAQAQLLSARANYETTLDAFKITLGLPPYLCVEIRDPLLDQFNLIGENLIGRRAEVAKSRDQVGQENTVLLNLSTSQQEAATGQSYRTIDMSNEVKVRLEAISKASESISETRRAIVEMDIPEVERDIAKLREVLPIRQKQLARLREIYETEKEMVCTLLPSNGLDDALFATLGVESLPDQLQEELRQLKERIEAYSDRIRKLQSDLKKLASDQPIQAAGSDSPSDDRARGRFEGIRDAAILQSQDLLASLAEDVLALQVIQARARTESVVLPEIDLSQHDAINIARRNRLDWMNARTTMVDSWRAIEVVADDLESFLDVVFSGDMQNRNDNPFSLQGRTGRLRVGLQWDSPLTRLQERNRYRQVLIEYQQAKRAFYLYEDTVWQTLRSQLRNIRFSQYNFELQRYAVRVAADQILVNEDLRQIRETLSQASGPTAARDSVSALNDLLTAQNTFLNVWVFYEGQRRNLDQDLGTMQVDAEGIWCDPGSITAERYLVEGQPMLLQDDTQRSPTPYDLEPLGSAPPVPSTVNDISIAPNSPAEQSFDPSMPYTSSNAIVQPVQESFATGMLSK
ncbi:MAG: hypothetical protein SGI77_08215 [Pirellulaceae bacterium]|nr:hypothetical protein [Pirellulaceae bacterium]